MNRIIKLWLPILMLLLITTVSAQEPYYVLDFCRRTPGSLDRTGRVGSSNMKAPNRWWWRLCRSGRSIKLMGLNEVSMIGDCFYYACRNR